MRVLNLGAFLGNRGSTASDLSVTDSRLGLDRVDLPAQSAYLLAPGRPTPGLPTILLPSIARTHKYVNINTFSISYVFRPHLRDRLTPGRLPLPGKPWVYGEYVFHIFYRYSCQHDHFHTVHCNFHYNFFPYRTLPYPLPCGKAKTSAPCLAPLHFRRRIIRPVSYYAFFKRWLLLSQRPGCLNDPTTFSTEHGFGGLSCWSGLFPF